MFSLRLKELRKNKKLTQCEFAKLINVSNGAVGNWESGTREPDSEMFNKIADFFGVSIDYLLGRTDNPSAQNSLETYSPSVTENYTTFPVIGDVAAGYDHIANERFDGEVIDVPLSYLKGRSKEDFFVLKVTGDSMFPHFHENDKVLVLKQSTLNYSGQIGVVLYGDDKATLKRVEYKTGEDWLNLVAINPNFPPTRIDGEALTHCRILGIPLLLIREFDE